MNSYVKKSLKSLLKLNDFKLDKSFETEKLTLLLYANDDNFHNLEYLLPHAFSSFSISMELACFISRIVVSLNHRNILEFGSGVSSLLIAKLLNTLGGGGLTSVESNPRWCSKIWNSISEFHLVDSNLIESQPQLQVSRKGVFHSYRTAAKSIGKHGPYDLVLIDGPQWFFGRDGSLHISFPFLKKGALIILDDAGRPGERWSVWRWLRTYPGLQLAVFEPEFPKNGISVLYNNGERDVRYSLNCFITSLYHTLVNLHIRRKNLLHS